MPLTVQVVTPEREVEVSGDATLVIARSVDGDVGIMSGHAPYLAALGRAPMTIVHEGNRREVLIVDGGFMQVKDDSVIVLAEYAILPAEVDRAVLPQRLEELRRQVAADAANRAAANELARLELVSNVVG